MAPPIQKRFPSQKPPRRKGRARTYLLIALIILIIAVGSLVYVSLTSNSTNTGDFTLIAPFGITIQTNSTTTTPIRITASNGFKGVVQLTAAVPPNVTATINPANVTGGGTVTLTMRVTRPGNYSATITGTSGAIKHSVTPIVATPIYATLGVTNGTISGTIEVELYRAQAPKTVSNFVNLAQSGFYSHLVWHRIVRPGPNSAIGVIQTGDPNTRYGNTSRSTWGSGVSSPTVPLEINRGLNNTAGTLAMARLSDPNSGSCQFYINAIDNLALDTSGGGYTVFGKVIKDPMNMVGAIYNHPTDSNPADSPVDPLPFLLSVTISDSP